jgi:hypothetical protein
MSSASGPSSSHRGECVWCSDEMVVLRTSGASGSANGASCLGWFGCGHARTLGDSTQFASCRAPNGDQSGYQLMHEHIVMCR